MNDPRLSRTIDSAGVDEQIAVLVEEIGKRLRANESVDLEEEYCRKYPELADSLRQVVPTLKAMAELGYSDDDGESQPEKPKTPKALGDFRIVRELGRGGMGVVYEAEQLSLGRTVALKVLPFASMLDERQRIRFKNEARAAATLDHPNIVSVFGTGEERGVHYYAMQLIRGHNLSVVIAELRRSEQGDRSGGSSEASLRKLVEDLSSAAVDHTQPESRHSAPSADDPTKVSRRSPDAVTVRAQTTSGSGMPGISDRSSSRRDFYRAAAKLGCQAALALDHAHTQGIVHRDIKPANLMLDSECNVFVTDFGLARIDSDAGMTMTGDLIGTLRYMSPEQALAQRVVVDHRTDVYSLGVTLYELLTLRPAFEGDDRKELLQKIAFDELTAPRKLIQDIPQDLETIVLKACAKSPQERYATAQELGEDLQRFLTERPILARRQSVTQLLSKWSRRNRILVRTVATTLAVAILVAGMLLLRERNRTRAALLRESNNLRMANENRAAAEANLTLARLAVDEFLDEVIEDDLLSVQGLEPLRLRLLNSALDFYQRLAKSDSDTPQLQAELARTHYRMSLIEYWLDQDSGHLNESIRLFERATATGHVSVETQIIFARALEASWRSHEAAAILKQLLLDDPTLTEARFQLAHVYSRIASRSIGSTAIRYLQQAIEVLEPMAEDADHRFYRKMGDTLFGLGQSMESPNKALPLFKRAAECGAMATQLRPSLGSGSLLSSSLRHVAQSQNQLGDLDGALNSLEQQAAFLRKQVYENPARPSLKAELYQALLDLGGQQQKLNQISESKISFADAKAIVDQTKRRDDPSGLLHLAILYAGIATSRSQASHADDEKRKNQDLALEALQRAVASAEPDFVANMDLSHPSLRILNQRADFARLASEVRALRSATSDTSLIALRTNHEAEEMMKELIGSDAPSVRSQRLVAQAWHAAGVQMLKIGEHAKARSSLAHAIERRTSLCKREPDNTAHRVELIASLEAMAKCCQTMGRHNQQREVLLQATHEYRALARNLPNHPQHFSRIGKLYESLIATTLSNGSKEVIIEVFRNELTQWQQLDDELIDSDICMLSLWILHQQNAGWLQSNGDKSDAARHLHEAGRFWQILTEEHLEELTSVLPTIETWASTDRSGATRSAVRNVLNAIRYKVKSEPIELVGRFADCPTWKTWMRWAIAYYRVSGWAGVQKETQLAAELANRDPHLLLGAVPLLLLSGDHVQYREVCLEAVLDPSDETPVYQFLNEQFEGHWPMRMRDSVNAFRYVALCVLDPNALEQSQQWLAEWIDRAGGVDPDHPYKALPLGLALIRFEKHRQAVQVLEDYRTVWIPPGASQAAFEFGLAIAHHHLLNVEQSQRWFDQALETMDEENSDYHYLQLMMTEVLRAEASSLIRREDTVPTEVEPRQA